MTSARMSFSLHDSEPKARASTQMTADVVSIEKVLNSRCSSSLETGSKKRHWGTLTSQRSPENVINQILRCCDIPRFSNGKLLHWIQDGDLYLGFEKSKNHHEERLLHVESGMQQEAVYLACAALGVGTCIKNQGINGTGYEDKIATSRPLVMEMGDPYESGKFTTKASRPEKPFKRGKNLREPARDGDVECLPQLEHIASFRKSGSSATETDISQLLWAAKGRTPHYIRLHVWNAMYGLTIPTWTGGQNHTSVYLMKDKRLFCYVNWTKNLFWISRIVLRTGLTLGDPTHDIRFVRNVKIQAEIDVPGRAIILCQNEKTGRALWEVGYMLENMLLQAKSLGISFTSKILKQDDIKRLESNIISNAVAALFL